MVGQPSPRLPAILMLLLSMLLVAAQPGEASPEQGSRAPGKPGWKGTREVRDGVIYVSNPAEPLEGTVEYELRDLWRLESETAAGELVFGVIEDVAEDTDGNIYLLDTQLKTVHIVSREGRYLRSIGRAGEGPGEFREPVQILYRPGSIVAVVDAAIGGVVLLTTAGVPLSAWSVELGDYSRNSLTAVYPLATGYAVQIYARRVSENELVQANLVATVNDSGDVASRFLERQATTRRGDPFTYDEAADQAVRLFGTTRSGNLLVSDSYSEFAYSIYDGHGVLRERVACPIAPAKRSATEIAELEEYWKNYYRGRREPVVIISDHERNIDGLHERSDEQIWVSYSSGWSAPAPGVFEKLLAFDQEGRYLHDIVLRSTSVAGNDYWYPVSRGVVIVVGGHAAEMTAGGATTEGEASAQDAPYILCCELVSFP